MKREFRTKKNPHNPTNRSLLVCYVDFFYFKPDKGFSDISAGEKMLISSPEKISEFIFTIPKGSYLSIKELRRGLALKAGADNTCPVTTGIFLRMAIEQHKDDENFPYWRVVDEKHPVVKKLNLDGNQIKMRRVDEGIPY